MKEVGIFSFGRKKSERVYNKMLRPFANTTLTDIILQKLKKLPNSFFAGYEKEFEDKCKKWGVKFIKRDKNSIIIDKPIIKILSFLKNIDYKYFLIINGCLPFLKIGTINEFLSVCKKHKPLFSIVQRDNFFINSKCKPINFDVKMETINTKLVDPVYEFSHALYFFNKEYFFEHKKYWDWKKVNYYIIKDKLEVMDIDTERDFKIAQILYRNDYNCRNWD